MLNKLCLDIVQSLSAAGKGLAELIELFALREFIGSESPCVCFHLTSGCALGQNVIVRILVVLVILESV